MLKADYQPLNSIMSELSYPPVKQIRDSGSQAPAVGLRVVKGALVPATEEDYQQLKTLDLSLNQTIFATIDFAQKPGSLKRIHRLGQLLVEQVPMFAHLDAHQAIKVLQSLSGAGCDVISVPAGTLAALAGMECQGDPNALVTVFQPWSLSPSSLTGPQFERLFSQLCRYVATEIWPDLDPGDIERWTDLVHRDTP
ncbi:hypothetical protein [Marinobacter lutaoensis]|uniref:hypothetical protein n=1 Tax=Marinobacter lutaoensis TaxID=135739 RepID=UPI00158BEC82|nr:hypothetical protein [Marinobacter lutaoensis]